MGGNKQTKALNRQVLHGRRGQRIQFKRVRGVAAVVVVVALAVAFRSRTRRGEQSVKSVMDCAKPYPRH